MKLLIPCSTLDLRYRLGCTPTWWQLLKALNEAGNEIITIPFLGDPIESLWWRTYPNPCSYESKVYNRYLDWKTAHRAFLPSNDKKKSIINRFSEHYIRSKWENYLISILNQERDIDIIFFLNVPLNFIQGIPEKIKSIYDVSLAYFDGDMPTSLPRYAIDRGFKFNHFLNTDLSNFDVFFTNSKGSIKELKNMGANNVQTLYYAADPELLRPLDLPKTIDISFFGYGSSFREEWMNKMITYPSNQLPYVNFNIGGKGFDVPLGKAKIVGDLSFSAYREFCNRSKICLNISRWSHTNVYGSATARLFELAAMKACIVSQPYLGIEEWFDSGRELIIVNDEHEALEIYSCLLSDDDERKRISESARARILKEHTYRHRAHTILNWLHRSL